MQPSMMEDPDGLFYLKCNNFSRLISSQYELLRDSKTFTDISFVCGDNTSRLDAHKLVLCASSPYFRSLIESLGTQHLVLFFGDVKYDIMKSILTYMYMGEAKIESDKIKDFIKVAEKFCIRGLVRENSEEKDQEATNAQQQQAEKRPRIEGEKAGQEKETTVSEVGQAICSALAEKLTGGNAGGNIGNIQVEYTEVHEDNSLMPSLKTETPHWMEGLENSMDPHGGPKSIAPPPTPGTSSHHHHHNPDDDRHGNLASKRISNCMTPTACNICGRIYSNASNLKQHMRLIHNPAPVICPICKKHYSSNLYLKRHFNAVHGPGGSHQKHDEWDMQA